jgi:hypothetical protein
MISNINFASSRFSQALNNLSRVKYIKKKAIINKELVPSTSMSIKTSSMTSDWRLSNCKAGDIIKAKFTAIHNADHAL